MGLFGWRCLGSLVGGAVRGQIPLIPAVEKLTHPAMDSFGGGVVERVRDVLRTLA